MDYVTDIEFAAYLQAKGFLVLDIVPVDERMCQFGFGTIPERLYRAFMNNQPPSPELAGIRAYRHLVADAQNKLHNKRGGSKGG